MDFDFEKFLQESKSSCKKKSQFVARIDNEKSNVLEKNEGNRFLYAQKYLDRLDNAKFCVKNQVMKEKDKYNDLLAEIIDNLE